MPFAGLARVDANLAGLLAQNLFPGTMVRGACSPATGSSSAASDKSWADWDWSPVSPEFAGKQERHLSVEVGRLESCSTVNLECYYFPRHGGFGRKITASKDYYCSYWPQSQQNRNGRYYFALLWRPEEG